MAKRLECIDRAIKKYNKKCKSRNIQFYPNDSDMELYEYSKTINFQGEVKRMLKRRMDKQRKLERQNNLEEQ